MCLQNLWTKSLNYGIRFWSDACEKGWAESRLGDAVAPV